MGQPGSSNIDGCSLKNGFKVAAPSCLPEDGWSTLLRGNLAACWWPRAFQSRRGSEPAELSTVDKVVIRVCAGLRIYQIPLEKNRPLPLCCVPVGDRADQHTAGRHWPGA